MKANPIKTDNIDNIYYSFFEPSSSSPHVKRPESIFDE
jgi:hypothetical protein